jgi:hypothetical protein
MHMPPRLTPSQKEILRLVRSFKRLYGPWAIEAAMDALSHCPEKEWRPLVNHMDALIKLGMSYELLSRRFAEDALGEPVEYIPIEYRTW